MYMRFSTVGWCTEKLIVIKQDLKHCWENNHCEINFAINDHPFQNIGPGEEWTVINAVSPLAHYASTENRRLMLIYSEIIHQAVPTDNALTAGTEKHSYAHKFTYPGRMYDFLAFFFFREYE